MRKKIWNMELVISGCQAVGRSTFCRRASRGVSLLRRSLHKGCVVARKLRNYFKLKSLYCSCIINVDVHKRTKVGPKQVLKTRNEKWYRAASVTIIQPAVSRPENQRRKKRRGSTNVNQLSTFNNSTHDQQITFQRAHFISNFMIKAFHVCMKLANSSANNTSSSLQVS